MGDTGPVEVIGEDVEVSPDKRSRGVVELLKSFFLAINFYIGYGLIQKGYDRSL